MTIQDTNSYILVPGLSGGAVWFEDLSHRLGSGVKILPLPGHFGGAPVPSDDQKYFEQLAQQVVACISSHRTTLVLHSIASGVIPALTYKRMLSQLDIVLIEGNLTIEDCAWSSLIANLNDKTLETYVQRLRRISGLTFRKNIIRSKPAERFRTWAEPVQHVSSTALSALSQEIIDIIGDKEIEKCLSAHDQKLTYIYGNTSEVSRAVQLVKSLRGAIYEIPEAGHFPMIDDPDLIANILLPT